MQAPRKKIFFVLMGLLHLMVFSLSSFGGEVLKHDHNDADHRHEHHAAQKGGTSPLIEEMIRLDAVFRDVVSGVAMNDGKRVHAALETMHGSMEKTHEGVKHGTVTLSRNADRLNEFITWDKQFHNKLESLAHAAHRSDQAAMLALTKQLLDDCVKCHQDFRKL